MIKEIYVNGSSFTHGYGLDLPSFLKILNKSESEYPKWDASEEERTNFRISNNWPAKLQEKIKLPLTNEADYGGSWERVLRMTTDFVLKHENPSEVLYILEMPNAVRKDVWSIEDKRYKKVTGQTGWGEPHSQNEINAIENWYVQFANDTTNFEKEIRRLIEYSSWLKSLNCKHLIIPTEQLVHLIPDDENGATEFMKITESELKKLDLNLIKFKVDRAHHGCSLLPNDKSDFSPHEYWTTNLLVYYNDFIGGGFNIEISPNVIDKHPSLLGHKKISEQVYNYIQYFLENDR